VTDNEGEVRQLDESLGTGWTISYIVNGVVKESYRVIVLGDVNGDGAINSADYVDIKAHLQGVSILEGIFALAADVNGDGYISSADYVTHKAFLKGIIDSF